MEAVRRIPKIELTPGKLIGQGGFGSVLQGEYRASDGGGKCSTVALKILYSPVRLEKYAEFNVMAKFKHKNLVTLLGIVEAESNASSWSFNSCRAKTCWSLCGQMIVPSTIMKIGFGIINGMEYLHNMGYLHRTLAARNVLLDANCHAKITDYGMSKIIDGQGSNYYKIDDELVLPIRWVPKECIPSNSNADASHTQEADVWAFGVVVWEVATRGDVPYGAASSNTQVRQMIQNGSNPLKEKSPENCPADVIKIMEFIFVEDPSKRPTFMDLRKTFQELQLQEQEKEKESKGTATATEQDIGKDVSEKSEDAKGVEGAGTSNPKKKKQKAKKNVSANANPPMPKPGPDSEGVTVNSNQAMGKSVGQDKDKGPPRSAHQPQTQKKLPPPNNQGQGQNKGGRYQDRGVASGVFKGKYDGHPPPPFRPHDQKGPDRNRHQPRNSRPEEQQREWKDQHQPPSCKDKDSSFNTPSNYKSRSNSHQASREPSPPRPANEYERLNQQPPMVYQAYNHPGTPGVAFPPANFMNPMMMQMPMAMPAMPMPMPMPMYPQMAAQMGFPYSAASQMPIQVTVNQGAAPAATTPTVDKNLEEQVKKLQEKVKELELEKKEQETKPDTGGRIHERSYPRDLRPPQHFDRNRDRDRAHHHLAHAPYSHAKTDRGHFSHHGPDRDRDHGHNHGHKGPGEKFDTQPPLTPPAKGNVWIPGKEFAVGHAQSQAQPRPQPPPPKAEKAWNPIREAELEYEKKMQLKQEQNTADRQMVDEVTAAAVSAAVKGAIRAVAAKSKSASAKSDT